MRPLPPSGSPRRPPHLRRSSWSGRASGCSSPGCCRTSAWCWSSCSRIRCGAVPFDQNVVTRLELGCELRATAEDDEIVPVGARDVLTRFPVLVGGLGSKFKDGEVAVVAGVDGGVFAEEACEDYFVQIHGESPF